MSNSDWTAPKLSDRDIVGVIENWTQDYKRIAAGQFAIQGEDAPDSPLAPMWRALVCLCSESWHIAKGETEAMERDFRGGDAVQVSEDDDPLGLADAVQVSEDDDPPEVA
jgi:hypothetical protein